MFSVLNVYALVTKKDVCGNIKNNPGFDYGYWVRLSYDDEEGQSDYDGNTC